MSAAPIPRVLSIAGTDPTGGAGIQADLKSIGALGGYGMAVVTALVAQNTRGVRSVHSVPPAFLGEQLRAVSDDVEIDAVKIGMLHSREIVSVVSDWLSEVCPPVVVLDPVMVATSGDRLLDDEAVASVRQLCRSAHLVTPNLPELAVLVGGDPAASWAEATAQARALHRDTGVTVLLKGGHLEGDDCPDAIVDVDGVHEVPGVRVATRHTHGTGCSLSSAMATLAASGQGWLATLTRAKVWLTGALENAEALHVGSGDGPIDHFHASRPQLWSATAWQRTATVRADVDECSLVRGLGDGTLDLDRFHRYLAQDALYLRAYSLVLSRAAELAPREDERDFWAEGAASCLIEEERLHRVRIGEVHPDPGPATRGYLGHFDRVVAVGSYAELVAAVLPCYWLYTDVGTRLSPRAHEGHRYGDWLRTYADPEFAAATEQAVEIADRAAAAASAEERQRMFAAFDRSMRHELAFFETP